MECKLEKCSLWAVSYTHLSHYANDKRLLPTGAPMTKPIWQIESLRKTFFFPPGEAFVTPEGGLWQAVAGTAPADQTVKPLLKTSTESGLSLIHI